MRRSVLKHRGAKAGLPPGSLVFVGEDRPHKTRISLMDFDESQLTEREIARVDECLEFKDRTSVTWVNVDEVHEPGVLESFGRAFGFHNLMLEDILNTDQRPKVEDHGDYLYVVLKMLEWRPDAGDIDIEQLSLVVGPKFVISFQERAGDFFDPVRARIRESVGRIRRLGADYLAYTLLDSVIDQYFVVLERMGERVEALEDVVMTEPGPGTLARIHALKREMIFVRKAIWPLKEVIASLRHLNTPLIAKSTQIFLRDLQDHIVQVVEGVDTLHMLLADLMDTYLSVVSNRTNAVMRVLAVLSAVFMPLTFVTGIFGMNFHDMPPLDWRWGFIGSLVGMGLLALVMIVFFRRKGWL
jgi:magnesium transporter